MRSFLLLFFILFFLTDFSKGKSSGDLNQDFRVATFKYYDIIPSGPVNTFVPPKIAEDSKLEKEKERIDSTLPPQYISYYKFKFQYEKAASVADFKNALKIYETINLSDLKTHEREVVLRYVIYLYERLGMFDKIVGLVNSRTFLINCKYCTIGSSSIGYAFQVNGKFREAVFWFKKDLTDVLYGTDDYSVSQFHTYQEELLNIAICYSKIGNGKEALNALEKYSKNKSLSDLYYYYFGVASVLEGNYQDASESLAKFISKSSEKYDSYYWMALARFELKDFRGCYEAAEQDLPTSSTNEFSSLLKIDSRISSNDYDQAITLIESLIKSRPGFSFAYSEKAFVSILLGKWANAENNIQNALNISPDNLDAYIFRGYLRFIEERFDEALKEFQSVKSMIPAERSTKSGSMFLFLVRCEMTLGAMESLCKDVMVAIESENTQALQILKEKCPELNPKRFYNNSYSTPLEAMKSNSREEVDIFLAKGFDINSVTESGNTLLGEGVKMNDTGWVRWLIVNGGDVNKKVKGPDKKEITPLKLAIDNDNSDMILLLVEYGAVLNEYSNFAGFRQTPLSYAEANNRSKAYKTLKKQGAK